MACMQGLHLTADLRGCAPDQAVMTDPVALRAHCLHAVVASGLQPVGDVFHRFPLPARRGDAIADDAAAGGVTGVVLLAESHVAAHTWPELGAVTLDVYVCNLHADNSRRAQALLAALEAGFGAEHAAHQRLLRGGPPGT